MAVLQLEDLSGSVESVVFPEPFQRYQRVLETDAPLFIKGVLDVEDSGNRKILVNEITSLIDLRERMAKSVTIHVDLRHAPQNTALRLQSVIGNHPGETNVIFQLESPKEYLITLRLNHFVKIKADPQFIKEVEDICGTGAVRF
jgi:DNA polymerase-3 subunit alpha